MTCQVMHVPPLLVRAHMTYDVMGAERGQL